VNILNIFQRLQEQWERGVARALEETPRTGEAVPERLGQTAGLAVKAQIRSGKISIPACGKNSIAV
jgi:hypothetical protein